MRFSTAAAVAAFAGLASADIYVTHPVASDTCTAGQACTVSWNDSGVAPFLKDIGVCDVYLCTGGQFQQTCTTNSIGTIDVSQTALITFLPDATFGPNGNYYFIKFISQNYKSPSNPTMPDTAFSAKFALAGMSGTFTPDEWSQITGSAPALASATPVAAPSSSAAPAASSAPAVSKAASSAAAAASASSTAKKSGAVSVTAPGVVSGVTGVGFVMSFASVFLGYLAFGL